MKHTPGPWFDDGGVICGNGTHIDVEGSVVAYVDRTGDWPSFQRNISDWELRANARLIAAAPDLLEACKLARAVLFHDKSDCWATGPHTGDPINDLIVCPGCSALESMEAAIAKATGGAQ